VSCRSRPPTGWPRLRLLRNLEHALQYVDDAQTHLLPPGEVERGRIARLLGAADTDALLGEYRAVQDCVAGVFDSVFTEPETDSRQAPLPAAWHASAAGDNGALVEHLAPRVSPICRAPAALRVC
jgi:glutamate-ammonia-ligase adenylyltransferase